MIGYLAAFVRWLEQLNEKLIFTLYFYSHGNRRLGLYSPDFISGKPGEATEPLSFDSVALLLCLLSE